MAGQKRASSQLAKALINLQLDDDDGEEQIAEEYHTLFSQLKMPQSTCMFTSKNLNETDDQLEQEPQSWKEAMKSSLWLKSMEEEINKLLDKGTFIQVQRPTDLKIIKSVWAFKVKRNIKGEVTQRKSRLNAAGYSQIPGQDYLDTYASVGKKQSFRMVLRIIAAYELTYFLIDFESAFLNSKLDVTLYMEFPPGFPSPDGKVLHLVKGIYGLKQSANLWSKELRGVLMDIGYVPCTMDECLYFTNKQDLPLLIFTHVDDLLGAAYTGPSGQPLQNHF
jgi:hypothetical protein